MVETPKSGVRAKREERLLQLRAGVVPNDWKPPTAEELDQRYPRIEGLNQRLGFWVAVRRCARPVVGGVRLLVGVARNHEWRCGCSAYAIDGRVMQMIACATHGGEDDD